uniref:transmembrane protein 128 isoform X3 n=1 Tax=Myxine glutinosa TaxID=7769 RepID=UPI00358F9C4C
MRFHSSPRKFVVFGKLLRERNALLCLGHPECSSQNDRPIRAKRPGRSSTRSRTDQRGGRDPGFALEGCGQPRRGWWLKFGISLLCLSLSIACYCIVYLEWFRKLPDYDNYNPYLVPISTASFIAGGFCLMVALWPVWSVATPVILLTQFLGLVMFISLLG